MLLHFPLGLVFEQLQLSSLSNEYNVLLCSARAKSQR